MHTAIAWIEQQFKAMDRRDARDLAFALIGASGWDGDRHAAGQARELSVAAQQTEAALRAWLAYWSRWRPRPGRTTVSRGGNEGSPGRRDRSVTDE